MGKGANSGNSGARGSGAKSGTGGSKSGSRPPTGFPGGNWPSTTGNPSGGGRGNATPRDGTDVK